MPDPARPDYTILDHQLDNLAAFAGQIVAVVGFKKEILESGGNAPIRRLAPVRLDSLKTRL